MRRRKTGLTVLLLTWTLLVTGVSAAAEIRVAVASNFSATMAALAELFETQTDHSVILIVGSTGKHFAQIDNGAPFDVFFAADGLRPQLLEKRGTALAGSRFTYAVGKLVLWSSQSGIVDNQGGVLSSGNFRHLAIANPKLAPYGLAAQEVLQARGLWGELSSLLVRGENISQTFQFVQSGNADLGFVARSQLIRPDHPREGSYWEVPQALYTPILQQAVVLRESDAASAFIAFVKSEEALQIIRNYGYDTP